MNSQNFSSLLNTNPAVLDEMLNAYSINEIILDYKHEPVDFRFLDVNPSFEEISGFSKSELIGKTILDIMPKTDKSWIQACGEVALNETDICTQYYSPTLDRHFHVRIKSYEKGKFITVYNDVTSLVDAHNEMQEQKESYESLFNNIRVGLIRTSIDEGTILEANLACAKIFGFDNVDEFVGQNIIELYKDQSDRKKHRANLMRNAKVNSAIFKMKKANNMPITVLISSTLHYEDNLPVWIDSTVQDISKQQRDEEKLYQLAHFDALTKLSNRHAFMDRLKESVEKAKRYKHTCAIFFLDLDGFKEINDTYGHDSGDFVLITIADRLQNIVRKTDVVARMGGDEFTIIIEHYDSNKDLSNLAQKIINSVQQSITLKESKVHVTTSIGISIFPDDALDYDSALKHADDAMYRAKELGKNKYQFFTKELNIDSVNQMIFEMELRHAIEKDEMHVSYQPRYDLNGNIITAFEAFLHWENETYGSVASDDFCKVASQSDLIYELFEFNLEHSMSQVGLWRAEQRMEYALSITMAEKFFESSRALNIVKRHLKKHHFEPQNLHVQVPQQLLMQEKGFAFLYSLHELGVKIIIDNFGVGISSISDLSKLPIYAYKLDDSLMQHNCEEDINTLRAIINLGHNFNAKIISPNIKSLFHLEYLRKLHCDIGQGSALHEASDPHNIEFLNHNCLDSENMFEI